MRGTRLARCVDSSGRNPSPEFPRADLSTLRDHRASRHNRALSDCDTRHDDGTRTDSGAMANADTCQQKTVAFCRRGEEEGFEANHDVISTLYQRRVENGSG